MRREDDGVALVFVYGTLLRGEANHRRLHHARVRAAKAFVAGALLYDTGRGYPAMTMASGGPAVYGEVYEVDAATLRSLDELEDYYGPDDPRNEYERISVEAETGEGMVRAWTYVFREPPRGERIESGDWREHGRRRREAQ